MLSGDVLAAMFLVLQITLLEGILSIDNAAVLGAMANQLPEEPLPSIGINRLIPARLRHNQRHAVLQVGLLGAYAGRIAMLLLASYIIAVPELQLLGAAYLGLLVWNHFISYTRYERFQLNPLFPITFAWRTIKSMFGKENSAPQQTLEEAHSASVSRVFWAMVIQVELADLAFSLDNVVAAVAITPRIELVILGVAIGILIMRFAAQIFQKMIDVEPALGDAAYLILAVIASKLILAEFAGIHFPEYAQLFFSLGILLTVVVVARTRRRYSGAAGSSHLSEADLT